jgi:hypothetical protein
MSFTKYLKESEEVLVPGFGKLTRDQLKDNIKNKLDDLKKIIDNNDLINVEYVLYNNGVLESMIKKEVELLKIEKNKQEKRRK